MELDGVVVKVVETVAPVVVTLLVVLLGYAVALTKKQTAEIDNDIARNAILATLLNCVAGPLPCTGRCWWLAGNAV